MKSTLIVTFLVLGVFVIDGTKAELREKRYVAQGKCPENMTDEACREYAKEKYQNSCLRLNVAGGRISIAGCGKSICEGGLTLTDVDLSKPYPECCPRCIDPHRS